MADLLTTDEAATYLRLSERKLYELVAQGTVPCTKVTGRWLFPRAALDRWVTAGLIAPAALAHVAAPPIVGGSHDPLLEWALRESGCGLASLPEGSEEGLRRLARGEVMVAAIHLHALKGDDEQVNIATVADAPGLHDAVVIAFARREQGILVAPGNPLKLSDIASIAQSRARMAQRPARRRRATASARAAGTRRHRGRQSYFVEAVFARPGPTSHTRCAQAAPTAGSRRGRLRSPPRLQFLPLTWENFDLVLRQRDYFLPGPQSLFGFLRSAALRERATELGGYDIDGVGEVRLVN